MRPANALPALLLLACDDPRTSEPQPSADTQATVTETTSLSITKIPGQAISFPGS
jgi:hypothetical protein